MTSRANSLLTSLTRAAERGIAITTGGALTSKKVTSQKTTGARKSTKPRHPSHRKQKSSRSAEPGPVEKKSSGVLAKKPAETLFSHLPAAKPIVSAQGMDRRVEKAVDKLVTAAEPPETVVQRTAVAVEQTTFETLSAITTMRDAAPVMKVAELPAEQPALPRVLTNLVSVFGLGALASDTPGGPVGTPIALALLAMGVRRESEESVAALSKTTAVGNSPVAALTLTGATAAPTAALIAAPDPATDYTVKPTVMSPNTDLLTNVTARRPTSLNNTSPRFGIGGTDLGIMWDNGIRVDNPATTVVEQRQVLIAFGDTFAGYNPVRTGGWTINTLLRSSDALLSNGMYVRDGVAW